MALLRCQIELDCTTGLPEDAATNTIHISNGGVGDDYEAAAAVVGLLYQGGLNHNGLIPLMSNDLCEGTGRVTVYDLADDKPRVPRGTAEFSATPKSVSGMPGEVALCISFEGAPTSGVPQARRRGRIFMPWLPDDANTVGRPTQTLIDDVIDVVNEWGQELFTVDEYRLGIYSTVNETWVPAVGGWIDNAWDTQRRRGWAPTQRTTWG